MRVSRYKKRLTSRDVEGLGSGSTGAGSVTFGNISGSASCSLSEDDDPPLSIPSESSGDVMNGYIIGNYILADNYLLRNLCVPK